MPMNNSRNSEPYSIAPLISKKPQNLLTSFGKTEDSLLGTDSKEL